jgi:hypothetical protein
MSKDTKVMNLDPVKNVFKDKLTEFLQTIAIKLLQSALKIAVNQLLEKF